MRSGGGPDGRRLAYRRAALEVPQRGATEVRFDVYARARPGSPARHREGDAGPAISARFRPRGWGRELARGPLRARLVDGFGRRFLLTLPIPD